MSYQVLARKWRPKSFRELVGQEHVLKALVNALDHDRLHHAYLFTGTRGVGKTTIARILARCLNCETGVSSEPCGVCGACTEIDQGRFVDLIEVDAASRTKVEDTRELLDNVQYAPTRGRYKVYLIDEVHMLSAHSFNALLKTLEEPPPHVKFLLATTDPQKLPATILSRCLQFHLRNMSPERIVGHLVRVLEQEMIAAEEPALWLIARAADGSMRDALSLTDQAIGFGGGQVRQQDVAAMLGSLDHTAAYRLLAALAAADGAALLAEVANLLDHAADPTAVLDELLGLLHRLAVAQAVPDAVDNGLGDAGTLREWAGRLPAEDVQLFYQLGVNGRRDLPLSPDPRAGLEMALLRMLAFRPVDSALLTVETAAPATPPPTPSEAARPAPAAGSQAPAASAAAVEPPAVSPPTQAPPATAPPATAPPTKKHEPAPVRAAGAGSGEPALAGAPAEEPPPWDEDDANWQRQPAWEAAPPRREEPAPETLPEATAAAATGIVAAEAPAIEAPVATQMAPGEPAAAPHDAEDWALRFAEFGLSGVLGSVASRCWLRAVDGDTLYFVLDQGHATLYSEQHGARLAEQLGARMGRSLKVQIEIGEPGGETPAACRERLRAARLAGARAAIEADPHVRTLCEQFGARLDEQSIEPLDPTLGAALP